MSYFNNLFFIPRIFSNPWNLSQFSIVDVSFQITMMTIFFLTQFNEKRLHDFIVIKIYSLIHNGLYFSNHVFILLNFVFLYLKTSISALNSIPLLI